MRWVRRSGAAGVYVAYADTKAVRLYRYRGPATTLARGGFTSAAACPGPQGRLWVAWGDKIDGVFMTRSNRGVTAFEPVDALVVDAAAFTRYLDEHPRVTRLLLSAIVQKLRDSDRKRVEFGTHDTEGRVARRLVELAEEYGRPADRGVSITLPLTQQELAGWTSASREAVSKALGSLRACGWVSTDRRRVTVLDIEALRRRASSF